MECGQIFRYKALSPARYAVYSREKYAEAVQEGDVVQIFTDDGDYFWRFFDLESDYAGKVQRISALSPIMQEACSFGKGIRILNQDLAETIFSFIISANNNIKRIQQILERICQAIGEPTRHGFAFPSVEAFANSPAKLFASLGAGYRDKYLVQTAQMLQNYDLTTLANLDSPSARKELLKFCGVGPKVADCILLFGLKRGDVFPVDTWLKKVYHAYFEQGHKDSEISTFFCNLFGNDAGLCQQYLFYFQRKYGQTVANTVK